MALHDDAEDTVVVLPDGRTIQNLTDDEYAATYTEPGTTGGHEMPDDVLAAAMAEVGEAQ